MNTFLSSAQEALKEQYRAFAKEHVAAVAESLENQTLDLQEFLRKIGSDGYLGHSSTKEFGACGSSFLAAIVFVESVAQYDAGLGLTLAGHFALMELIKSYGSEAQKTRYLSALATGEKIGAVAVSETTAGTDFNAIQTKVEIDGEKVRLNGTKSWVVNGELASVIAVLANGENGPSFWLVDTSETSVEFSKDKGKLGLRSAHCNDMVMKDTVVSSTAALSSAVSANELVRFQSNVAKVVLAAAAVGLVEGALEGSLAHARSRQQFGKPISQFQAIQWKLADMGAESSASRLLTYRAAWSKEESPEDFSRAAAMCKLFATKVARVHSSEFVQILGSFGIVSESAAERAYRDAKVTEIAEGTSELQKLILTKELGV